MAEEAAARARPRCAPEQNINRFYQAFHEAKEHLDSTGTGAPVSSVSVAVPSAYHLARWTSIHVAAAALGSFRKATPVPTPDLPLATWDKVSRAAVALAEVESPPSSSKVRKLV
jgi:hypothetical protein